MTKQKKHEESPVALAADIRVRALADDTRRGIITVLYTRGPLFYNKLAEALHLSASHLAYHLNLLVEGGYAKRELGDRSGKSFARYSVTKSAVQFLEFIGAKKKLDEMKQEKTDDSSSGHLSILISSNVWTEASHFIERIAEEMNKHGYESDVAARTSKRSSFSVKLRNADKVRRSDMIVFVYNKPTALEHAIEVLGQSLASDKPVAILVESKYKNDFRRSDIASVYGRYAVDHMSVLEYNSENPNGAVQSLLHVVRSKSKRT